MKISRKKEKKKYKDVFIKFFQKRHVIRFVMIKFLSKFHSAIPKIFLYLNSFVPLKYFINKIPTRMFYARSVYVL